MTDVKCETCFSSPCSSEKPCVSHKCPHGELGSFVPGLVLGVRKCGDDHHSHSVRISPPGAQGSSSPSSVSAAKAPAAQPFLCHVPYEQAIGFWEERKETLLETEHNLGGAKQEVGVLEGRPMPATDMEPLFPYPCAWPRAIWGHTSALKKFML